MKKICDIILILLIIGAIIFGVIIGSEYIRREKNEDKLSAVVAQIESINTDTSKSNEENKQELIKVDGYDVEGIIEIPKINIKYPIVSKTSDEAMKVAITKFWGTNINDIGNYTMAGHNYKNGTMFGKTKYLEIGDKIKMTDLNLNTVEYEIFKIYTIDPDDVTCIESVDPNTREITLITCTNGHKNRLVTKAREIIK
ncbi:MAG: sortase [Clostridia bacterium]|nr:sortase [Clostridia bacterium]